MSTDTATLKRGSQDFRLRCQLYAPRHFALSDVNGLGQDVAPAPSDGGDAAPFIEAFDGISSFGTIGGSIAAGGWSCDLVIPEFPATFLDFYGVVISLQAWHGGVPGVPGAAGTAVEADIFRGWMREVTGRREYGKSEARFAIRSGSNFLQDSAFSRGIDYADGLDHAAPTTSNAIIAHLLDYHTNWGDRHPSPPGYGLYLPNHSLDAFSLNEGSVFQMLSQLADNFAGEGQVFCRRGDDLFIGASPSIIPDLHPYISAPIIDLDADLILNIEIPEVTDYSVTQVSVIAQKSDQTEYAARYFGGSGLGGRPKYQIRTDDEGLADYLAARLFAYLNRRYRNVRATMPLNVAIDLGDCITLTIALPQRGIAWSQKLFHVIAVEYQPDLQRRTWRTVVTCDEVVL